MLLTRVETQIVLIHLLPKENLLTLFQEVNSSKMNILICQDQDREG